MHNENHNLTAEQSVIGTLLHRPDAFDDLDGLQPGDFWAEENRVIFETISLMAMSGERIDLVTLDNKLIETGRVSAAGGLSYLADVMQNTPTTLNAKRYARIVRDYAMARRLAAAGAEVQKIADEPAPIEERIAKAQQAILAMDLEKSSGNEPRSIQEIAAGCIKGINARMQGEDVSGLMTGFYDLDQMTGGLQPGDLIIIAGRPSMGKTCLALNIAEHVADEGHVLFFSLEMTGDQLGKRSIASLGEIELDQVLHGRDFTDEQLERVSYAAARLHRMKLTVDEYTRSPQGISAEARRIKRKHGLSLIVVDYLGQMRLPTTNRNDTKANQISEISADMKALAKQLGVPLVLLSQLNRDVEKRPDKRPMMSDLRDSGAIEQDADLILFPYRDEYYYPDGTGNKGWAEVIIAKQRMGRVGKILLQFQGQYSRFVNPSKGTLHQYQPYGSKASGGGTPFYSGGFD